jgi:hypothetical protein
MLLKNLMRVFSALGEPMSRYHTQKHGGWDDGSWKKIFFTGKPKIYLFPLGAKTQYWKLALYH